jgi:hypothetical protein
MQHHAHQQTTYQNLIMHFVTQSTTCNGKRSRTRKEFGFSPSERATHKRGASSQRDTLPTLRMAAAKVTQGSHCYYTFYQQRTAGTAISVMTTGYIIKIDEFREICIWSGVVDNAKWSGKVHHGVAQFLTQRLGRACDCDTDAAPNLRKLHTSIRQRAWLRKQQVTCRRHAVPAHGIKNGPSAMTHKTSCSACTPRKPAA